ncbi:hypothetical protein F4811DRAFT_89278 [Daldinia bambusicola]|nr:hypothetical protein F4811DRAFT_89278 [Daldinia bambusicola]
MLSDSTVLPIPLNSGGALASRLCPCDGKGDFLVVFHPFENDLRNITHNKIDMRVELLPGFFSSFLREVRAECRFSCLAKWTQYVLSHLASSFSPFESLASTAARSSIFVFSKFRAKFNKEFLSRSCNYSLVGCIQLIPGKLFYVERIRGDLPTEYLCRLRISTATGHNPAQQGRGSVNQILKLVRRGASCYEFLNVPKSATEEEIEAAHTSLIGRVHPNKNKDQAADQCYRIVNAARDVLLNRQGRDSYDTRAVAMRMTVRRDQLPQ